MCPSPQTSQLPSMVLSLKDQAFRPQLLPRPRQLGTVPGLLAEAAAFMATPGTAVAMVWTGKRPRVSQPEVLSMRSHVALGSWSLAPACLLIGFSCCSCVEPLAHC